MKNLTKNKKRKAFTIVELVIVIAVIAILASVLLPTFGEVIGSAKRTAALTDAKTAYSNYFIQNVADSVNSEYCVYEADDGYVVAVHNGTPIEVYSSAEEALAALVGAGADVNHLVQIGNKLYAYRPSASNPSEPDPDAPTNPDTPTDPDTPVTPTEPTDWSGATAVFVGDSITNGAYADSGEIYYQCLKSKLGLASVTGQATSGSCISATSNYGTTNNPLINRWNQIPDAELIVIFMGTNDFGHATPLGTIADTTDVSFYGALNVIIPGIQAAHPDSQIVMITPLHRSMKSNGMTSADDNVPNMSGHTLEDYVNAIKAICEKYDLDVIDLYNTCTWDPANTTYFDSDKLHPSPNGHRALADLIAEAMVTIPREHERAPENPDDGEETDPIIESDFVNGNQFAPGFEENTHSATLKVNLWLTKGTVVKVVDNSKYEWAVAYTQGENGWTFATGKQYATSGWTSNATYQINENGWYCLIIRIKDGKTGRDFLDVADKKLADFFEITEPAFIELEIGNKLGGTTETATDTKRAGSSVNLYLVAGTTVTFKSLSAYKYAVGKTEGEFSYARVGNYLPENKWNDTIESFTITETGWYGFSICRNDGANFDLGGADSNNLWDYFEIVIPTENPENLILKHGNKHMANNTSYYTSTSTASSVKNIWLEKGTIVKIKDNATYEWTLLKTADATSEKGVTGEGTGESYYPTNGWFTNDKINNGEWCEIETSGYYGFIFKIASGTGTVDITTKNLLDYFEIVLPDTHQ